MSITSLILDKIQILCEIKANIPAYYAYEKGIIFLALVIDVDPLLSHVYQKRIGPTNVLEHVYF